MATLYDLAMQYLNQSLPKTFKYDRTNQPGTPPPVTVSPQDPNAPVKRILPVQGGGDGFSVYNPDPNRTRNEGNYSPYAYRQAAERSLIGDVYSSGTEAQKMMDNYPDYYEGKQLEGIPGAIANYAKNSLAGRIIGGVANFANDMLPVNQRAIYENELLGQGIALDDIGRIVSDGGDYNTAENIMAGYNANKVTAETFQKRREMIKDKMSDKVNPKTGKTFKQERLDALDGAEAKMLGTAKTRADTVFDDKSLAKDPDYVSFDDQLDINNIINTEKEDDENFDPLDPKNKSSIYTATAPTYLDNYPTNITDPGDGTGSVGSYDEAGINEPTVYANENNSNSVSTSGLTYNQGGGQGGSYDEAGIGPGYGGGSTYDEAGINTGPTVGNATAKNTYTDAILRGNTGGGNDSSSNSRDKIVCTMMNESYGFGSFRNKIWLKHSKSLAPEYQKGYHKIFLPLIKIAKTNKVVRKILEHIAVHRTIDIRQESRGKVHLLGRVYRKILEPICYFVGKHG